MLSQFLLAVPASVSCGVQGCSFRKEPGREHCAKHPPWPQFGRVCGCRVTKQPQAAQAGQGEGEHSNSSLRHSHIPREQLEMTTGESRHGRLQIRFLCPAHNLLLPLLSLEAQSSPDIPRFVTWSRGGAELSAMCEPSAGSGRSSSPQDTWPLYPGRDPSLPPFPLSLSISPSSWHTSLARPFIPR